MMETSYIEEEVAEAVIGLLLLKGLYLKSPKARNEKTSKELEFLESVFEVSSYPDFKVKKVLSILLRMTQKTIQIWFQNRRRNIKSVIRREALAERSNFMNFKIVNGQVNRKRYLESGFFVQKDISIARILRIYCKIFNIDWVFGHDRLKGYARSRR